MPIPEGSHTVGREEHNYLCVPDQSVSRRHAQVTNSADGLFIEDLGSSNGTAVRGEFITNKTQVNIGDVVFFGSASFRVEPEVTSDSASATPSAPTKPAEPKPAPGLKPAVSSIQFAKASIPLPTASKEMPAEGEMVPVEEEEEESTPIGSAGATLQLPKLSQLPSRPSAGSPPGPVALPAHLGGEQSPRSVGFPAPASLPLPQAPAPEPPPAPGMLTVPSILAFLVGLGIGIALGVTVLAKYFH